MTDDRAAIPGETRIESYEASPEEALLIEDVLDCLDGESHQTSTDVLLLAVCEYIRRNVYAEYQLKMAKGLASALIASFDGDTKDREGHA